MSLYVTVGDDLKQAMKAGDVFKRDTLRLLQSAIKNVAIEKRSVTTELPDATVEDIIKKLVKQRKESITQYLAGGRADLAKQEESELVLLSEYLPEAMPEAELHTLVKTTLKEAGIFSKDNMGQAMGASMRAVDGRASGDDVKRIVASLLS